MSRKHSFYHRRRAGTSKTIDRLNLNFSVLFGPHSNYAIPLDYGGVEDICQQPQDLPNFQ